MMETDVHINSQQHLHSNGHSNGNGHHTTNGNGNGNGNGNHIDNNLNRAYNTHMINIADQNDFKHQKRQKLLKQRQQHNPTTTSQQQKRQEEERLIGDNSRQKLNGSNNNQHAGISMQANGGHSTTSTTSTTITAPKSQRATPSYRLREDDIDDDADYVDESDASSDSDPNVLDSDELANAYKNEGNELFKREFYSKAIEKYSKSIDFRPSHMVYTNRSAAYYKLRMYEQSLADAVASLRLRSTWVKGYLRMGMALVALNRLDEAKELFYRGLELDRDNVDLHSNLSHLLEQLKSKSPPITEEIIRQDEDATGDGSGTGINKNNNPNLNNNNNRNKNQIVTKTTLTYLALIAAPLTILALVANRTSKLSLKSIVSFFTGS
ncbi:hypothetical protein SAMD00019534_051460, partial [Acytostelium subglobosum LB1]|uniref:hypothetical protein n=1 Tax=Acytostelium subglobosum LB1 TaxID=1410327 RepID=UPI000644CBDB